MKPFLLLLALFGLVFQAESQSHDATWWNAMDDKAKLYFVVGYGDGFDEGTASARSLGIAALHLSSEQVNKMKPDDVFGDANYGTIRKGVDACYSDFRNTSLMPSTCIDWVMMGIQGVPEDQREEYLRINRIAAALPRK